MTICRHPLFSARVDVKPMVFADGGPVIGYMAVATICCAECQTQFRFKGLEAGMRFSHPTVSIDGLELHVPLEPDIIPEIAGVPVFHGTA